MEAIEELAIHLADFSIANRIIAFYYAIFHSDCIDLNRIMYGLSKKKMPYLYLVDEAIGLLNNEIHLVECVLNTLNSSNHTLTNNLFPLFIWQTKQT